MEIATASIDVTPSRPLPTACHGPLNTPSDNIALPFEANMIALRENGQTLVIVTLDWFFIGPGLRPCILERCAGRLDDASLFVAASHAHTSPATDRTKNYTKVDETYLASAETAIATAVNEMLSSGDWRTAVLRFTTTACDCAIHRRRRIWWNQGGGVFRTLDMHPNPTGPRDRELRLLRVEDEAGKLLSVLWGVSCHPTAWPRLRELSSDFPGGVRQALRAHVGFNVPVLFLQGFCGDLRPPAMSRWPRQGSLTHRLIMFGMSLLNGPFFEGFSPEEHRGWQDGIAACAIRALDETEGTAPLATRLALHKTSIALAALGLSGRTDALTFHWFDLSEQLRVTGMSAEPCWEYTRLVSRAFPGKTIWPVGYIDNVFGYLPTQAMLAEGGYEVSGFKKGFGVTGDFVRNLEKVIERLVSS